MPNGNGKERDYKKEYEYTVRLLKAQEVGIKLLTEERDKSRTELITAMQINVSLEKQMYNLKDINRNVITGNNEKEQEFTVEIQRLREMVKELGGDPN